MAFANKVEAWVRKANYTATTQYYTFTPGPESPHVWQFRCFNNGDQTCRFTFYSLDEDGDSCVIPIDASTDYIDVTAGSSAERTVECLAPSIKVVFTQAAGTCAAVVKCKAVPFYGAINPTSYGTTVSAGV